MAIDNQATLNEFGSFLDNEFESARRELAGLKTDANRRHLQKLVYTNLMDRFDSLLDRVVLDNKLNDQLLDELLEKFTEPLSEGEVLRLLIDQNRPSAHLDERVEGTLRQGVLRQRHSLKFAKILKVYCGYDERVMKEPVVNPNDGKIYKKIKPPNNKIPCSIPGYADWLYSRRNAIVHGGGSAKMLVGDLKQMQSIYGCDAGKTVNLKLNSLRNAADFYRGTVKIMIGAV